MLEYRIESILYVFTHDLNKKEMLRSFLVISLWA